MRDSTIVVYYVREIKSQKEVEEPSTVHPFFSGKKQKNFLDGWVLSASARYS